MDACKKERQVTSEQKQVQDSKTFPKPKKRAFTYAAEKARPSSCLFADKLAQHCLRAFRCKVRELNAGGACLDFRQTVFAAIVMTEGRPKDNMTDDKKSASIASDLLVNDGPVNCKQPVLTKKRGKGIASKPMKVILFDKMHVVACGVGTKFCRKQQGLTFSDCHAEVLARRSFKHFLWTEMLRCLGDACTEDYLPACEKQHINGKQCTHLFAPIFHLIDPSNQAKRPAFRLRDDINFHLYTTSTPCGNATIKRWGSGQSAPKFPYCGPNEIPIEKLHPRYHFAGIREGEIRCLFKDTSERKPKHHEFHTPTSDVIKGQTVQGKVNVLCSSKGQTKFEDPPVDWTVPAGCATLCQLQTRESQASEISSKSNKTYIRTCSAKIARWNVLGLQGRSLFRWLADGPIFLTSCIVGRKFSHRHCRRALCCRLQDFHPNSKRGRYLSKQYFSGQSPLGNVSLHKSVTKCGNSVKTDYCHQKMWPWSWPPGFTIHHPTLLSTCIKFDDSELSSAKAVDACIEGQVGASFGEWRCIAWCPSNTHSRVRLATQIWKSLNLHMKEVVIDGRVGKPLSPPEFKSLTDAPTTTDTAELSSRHRAAIYPFTTNSFKKFDDLVNAAVSPDDVEYESLTDERACAYDTARELLGKFERY